MIVESLIVMFFGSINLVLNLLPNLPNLPSSITNGMIGFIDLIFNNIGLLGLFIPIATIKIVVPLIVLIVNFDKIYKLGMWVIKKLPFLNMK